MIKVNFLVSLIEYLSLSKGKIIAKKMGDQDKDILINREKHGLSDIVGDIILDSGAYSFYNEFRKGRLKREMDAEEHTDIALKVVDILRPTYFVQLDFIGRPRKTEEAYQKQKEFGFSMVVTLNQSIKSLEGSSDLVFLGGIRTAKSNIGKDYYDKIKEKFPKIHIFGKDSFSQLAMIRPYSSDSSRMIISRRYCKLTRIINAKVSCDYTINSISKIGFIKMREIPRYYYETVDMLDRLNLGNLKDEFQEYMMKERYGEDIDRSILMKINFIITALYYNSIERSTGVKVFIVIGVIGNTISFQWFLDSLEILRNINIDHSGFSGYIYSPQKKENI